MKKSGFAIILVLATLVLLALLSITYIKLALIDRNIARNYMDNKRAKLIAQSGIEYAIARLQENPFGTGWVALGDQKSITINGINTNYTESAGSTYGQDRDIFAVTVKDCQSMINVNDGLGNDRVTANTKRILNVLGDVVGIDNLGNKLLDDNRRPPQGYTSKQELLKYLTRDEFNTVKNLITTHAWQDPNVANPVPLSSAVLGEYPVKYNTNISGENIYRYGKGKDHAGNLIVDELIYAPTFALASSFDHAIYGLDELNPQWIEIVSRSPVNVNTAPKNILIALLRDLEGFFISDRRHRAFSGAVALPGMNQTYYSGYKGFHYNKGEPWPDEVGFLYSTESLDPIFASDLSDAIKACVEKKSIIIGGKILDYTDIGNLWFRGPIRTWMQFNTFIDDLVQRLIIQDSRSDIFLEYDPSAAPFNPLTIPSSMALKLAHQAKADCLKANFNPNLHLNETNPDANILTLVDKTDLIVNSTEFCFTPMGIFEIESEGFILKAKDTENIIIARSKVESVIKLFDAYRETSQRQFLAGQIPNAATNTNNGFSLETGPEPSHISTITAMENEFDGYIQLPTFKYESTFFGVAMSSHFTRNFDLDRHADGALSNITINAADKTEGVISSPYTYNSRNRLCRSYRAKLDFVPNPVNYAPADLRIDGAYLERHSGLAYSISEYTFYNTGVFCYWIKPSFHPEITGKVRSFLNISSDISSGGGIHSSYLSGLFFAHYFIPASLNSEDTAPSSSRHSTAPYYRQSSMIFCFSAKRAETVCNATGFGQTTPCLNHEMHADGKISSFKAGRWAHVICRYNMGLTYGSTSTPPQPAEIYINGNHIPNTSNLPTHPTTANLFTRDTFLSVNRKLFIGPAGLYGKLADERRNWPADSTIDEFYSFVHYDLGLSAANTLYKGGRYYRPPTDQSQFISQAIDLKQSYKLSPSKTSINNPASSSEDGIASQDNRIQLLGLAWTMYAEGINTTTGQPTLTDYKTNTQLNVQMKIKLVIDGIEAPELYENAGYSAILKDYNINLRYKLIVNIEGLDTSNSILLYSLIFDDITIYYTSGVKFMSYSYFD